MTMHTDPAVPMLEMRGITKRFPGVLANDRVDLSVLPGQVHTLLGENGAGKSTLMKILYGLYRPDEGEILLDGEPVEIASPTDAIRRGIGMIHQHFMLVETLTVAENVALGLPSTRGPLTDLDRVSKRIQELDDVYGLRVDPEAYIWQLAVGQKQRVEIIKVLFRGAEILILDEPTAGVDVELRHTLWDFVREINGQGTTILLTTHYLEEAEQMCDRIAIMNHGKLIALEATRTLLKELGTRSLLIHLQTPVKELPANLCCQGAELDASGTTLQLTMSAGQATGDLLKSLCEFDLPIADIETRKASLEEIFLQLTQVGRVEP